MPPAQQAARLTDPVTHGWGMVGLVGGALLGKAEATAIRARGNAEGSPDRLRAAGPEELRTGEHLYLSAPRSGSADPEAPLG